MNEIRDIQAIGTSMDTSFISFNIDHPIELFWFFSLFFFSSSRIFISHQTAFNWSKQLRVPTAFDALFKRWIPQFSLIIHIHTEEAHIYPYFEDIFSENDFSFPFIVHTGSFCCMSIYLYNMFNLFLRQNIMCCVVILWKGKSYLRNNDISQIILQ